MLLEETSAQIALRGELRTYFSQLLTPGVRAELAADPEGGPVFRRLVRQMGTDGWLGVGWPEEFGGQGRPATDQFIFFDEVQRAAAPFPFVTLNTVGPTLMSFGSEQQKKEFLPGIVAGEINFAIGYTEPEAGTDLASLKTRAVLDGDEYVINGNKVFTSGADQADYIWLACRTDTEAPKHRGISIILVPTSTSGFSATPIVTVGGTKTTASYYSDVRVPVANRVGEENAGWRMITTQLNHERVGLAALGGLAHRLWDDVAKWCAATDASPDQKMIDVPWVQLDLARTHAKLEAMRLLNWRMAAAVAAGTLSPGDSSAVKVYGTECAVEAYQVLLGIVGSAGYLRAGSGGAALAGELEKAGRSAQINTFGGGVNEVQREIVASVALKMARQAR
ncbi:MAG: acyl-CoA dehydrogenase family protein [Actinobacteria bacterium]|nr:acyl-CoA dehydrogenase family protein [Actinomycetota bacterium]